MENINHIIKDDLLLRLPRNPLHKLSRDRRQQVQFYLNMDRGKVAYSGVS